jgi:hypothetical protein
MCSSKLEQSIRIVAAVFATLLALPFVSFVASSEVEVEVPLYSNHGSSVAKQLLSASGDSNKNNTVTSANVDMNATVDNHLLLNTTTTNAQEASDDLSCGIYFADSTIPGAGWGIFAGVRLEEDEEVPNAMDAVVSFYDTDDAGILRKLYCSIDNRVR